MRNIIILIFFRIIIRIKTDGEIECHERCAICSSSYTYTLNECDTCIQELI